MKKLQTTLKQVYSSIDIASRILTSETQQSSVATMTKLDMNSSIIAGI